MMKPANMLLNPRPHGAWPASAWMRPGFNRGMRAFTLTEMLVALAVMVLAMAVVTNVFSVTTKTAATSAAIADAELLARGFADQLQQDLEHCDPSQSILVIHGRTQAAALTEDLRQGGQYYRVLTGDPGRVLASYDTRVDGDAKVPNGTSSRDQYSDPRADILMFFTNRPTASSAPAPVPWGDPFQETLSRGASVHPVQVVYGHAALDTAVQSGGAWAFANNLQHIETGDGNPNDLSPLPANRWHLSRRVTLLDEQPPGSGVPQFLVADFDRIVPCYSTNPGVAADSVPFRFADYLNAFAWKSKAQWSPYGFPTIAGVPLPAGPGHRAWPGADASLVNWVLYANGVEQNHHVATVIESPPAALQSNLGVHLVPGCVWFQVEFLMPEDPRNGLDHPLSDQRRDTPRWVEVERGATYVFVPDTDENRQLVESLVVAADGTADINQRLATFKRRIPPSGTTGTIDYAGPDSVVNRRVRMWPYAIRVTVRVFDQRGRLDRPIVRSVVHRFD